jgi:SAM-dependent methyltransferase
MTAADIRTMSYPDFVAFMGQENTPPGGAQTVSLWRRWARERESTDVSSLHVLDLACSTGFSGRTFADSAVDCRVTGIDLSCRAITVAVERAAGDRRFSYQQADAAYLPLVDESVDIVLSGCNFAFIDERERALAQVFRVLRAGGWLMTANFFYRQPAPAHVMDDVHRLVGFRPSANWTLPYWRSFFSRGFSLAHAEVTDLHAERRWPIARYAAGSALVADSFPMSLRQRSIAARRMYRTRAALNRQRDFQGVAVEAWRKT